MVKTCLPIQKMQVQSLGWEDPLEEEMATHSSTLAWEMPWTEELQSMGSQRVRRDLAKQQEWALAGGWGVDPAERAEVGRKASEETGLLRGGQAGILRAPEVSEAACPASRLCSYPHRPGLSFKALVKATVICLLGTLFGTCGKGPTDMGQSVSFFVLAILNVAFGKSEKSESVSNLVATPSSCFENRPLVIMTSTVYLQLRLPVLSHEEGFLEASSSKNNKYHRLQVVLHFAHLCE